MTAGHILYKEKMNMKKTKLLCVGLTLVCAMGCFIGCKKNGDSKVGKDSSEVSVTSENTSSEESADQITEKTEKKKLSKEEIAEIEKQYRDSANVFSIESFSSMGETRMFGGKVEKGSFDVHSIVSYVDDYGDVKTAELSTINVFKGDNTKIDTSTNSPTIVLQVTDPQVENTSIIFKTEEVKAVSFSIVSDADHIQDISAFFAENSSVEAVIDGKSYSCTLAGYRIDDLSNLAYGALVFSEDFPYEGAKDFEIKGIEAKADMSDLLH